MMKLVDTHCHLDFADFDADREKAIERAYEAGVKYMINVASSIEGSRKSVELAGKYDPIYASVGIHPYDAKEASDSMFAELRDLAKNKKVVAIGEVGLDYYRDLSPRSIQQDVFRKFVGFAKETNLPLIIHCREAQEDLLRILKEEAVLPVNPVRNGVRLRRISNGVNGVVHCFPPDKEFLKAVLDMGLHVSFTCNITFKNASALRQMAKEFVPLDKLLLETDAPFLAPEAFRGKRNEPSYLTYLAEEVAGLKGITAEDVARVTSWNSKRLFGVGPDDTSGRGAIVYPIRRSLYINLTNRCTDNCVFCVRNTTEYVMGYNLRLDREPTAQEIIEAVGDPTAYEEIVFCGYGEPTLRLDCIIEVARALKKKGARIRLTTNGHGNLIHNRPIVGDLVGLIDKVSISLNAPSAEVYSKVCRPSFGLRAFGEIKKFIIECRERLPEVEVTCIDMEGIDIKECERLTREELKVQFRPRRYNVVG